MFPEKKYWINDLNEGLYHFWKILKQRPRKLIAAIQKIKNNDYDGLALYKSLKNKDPKCDFDKAVRFFVLNRITFSGTTEAGGYSKDAFANRFTQSSIDRLKHIAPLLKTSEVTNDDYAGVLKSKGKNVFIFLDPPYYSATKSKLYGKNGKLHTTFDHERFAIEVRKCKHKWLITYDDCKYIRKLFSFASIYTYNLQYGMNNYKQNKALKGKELIITNC